MLDVDAARDWLTELTRRRAQRTVATPGGFAVRDDAYPLSHDHNKLLVLSSCDGAALAAADALARAPACAAVSPS